MQQSTTLQLVCEVHRLDDTLFYASSHLAVQIASLVLQFIQHASFRDRTPILRLFLALLSSFETVLCSEGCNEGHSVAGKLSRLFLLGHLLQKCQAPLIRLSARQHDQLTSTEASKTLHAQA